MSDRRVLQVLASSAGGIARHVAQVTGALDGRDGLAVDIAAPVDLPIAMPKPVLPVAIPSGPASGHRAAIARLRGHLSAGGYDVVHAHGLRAGIDSSLAVRGQGIPVLVTVHNLVRPEVTGRLRAALYARSEGVVVRLATHVFAVSAQIAEQLRRRARSAAGKVEVLYLGVDDPPTPTRSRAEVREQLGLTETDSLVVTAARLAPQKSLHVLVDAIARLDGSVHLALAGQGPLEDALRARARSLGLADRAVFLGFVADLQNYLAAADVFCLSSAWEGIPLATQEAMLLGTPVVATSVGGMPELIEDGRSGRLVAPGDPGALAGALRDVLDDADDYAVHARERLRERFSTEKMLARLEQAYGS